MRRSDIPTSSLFGTAHDRVRCLAVFVGCAVVLATGCATTGGLVPPEVTLVDLELVEATVFESTFKVKVRATNDNLELMTLEGAVLKLQLEGRKFGRGATAERVEIPKMGSVVLELDVHVNHVAVATRIRGIMESKQVNYGMTGHVFVARPSGGRKKLHIHRDGSLDLGKIEADPPAATPADGVEMQ